MNPMQLLPYALISGAFGLAQQKNAQNTNLALMGQQFQYSKQLMDYQHKLNSPAEYMQQLKDAGVSPAVALSKGMSQVETSLGSTPQSDLSGASVNSALAAQMANVMSQTAVNYASADKIKAETTNIQTETAGMLTDNEFKALLNQGRLDELNSEVSKNLSQSHLNDAEVTKTNKEYDLLCKQLDEIDAHIAEMQANASQMTEMAAFNKLRQQIEQDLAKSKISVDKATIKQCAAAAYNMVKQGDAAAVDKANKEIQGLILDAEQKNAHNRIMQENFQRAEQTRSERAKTIALELQNQRTNAGQGFATSTPIAITSEIFKSVGNVFGATIPFKP